jgi:hypothetical protein
LPATLDTPSIPTVVIPSRSVRVCTEEIADSSWDPEDEILGERHPGERIERQFTGGRNVLPIDFTFVDGRHKVAATR